MTMEGVVSFVLSCLPRPAVTRHGTLSAAADGGHDGTDRISALHDDLLVCEVVSRLPIKDAVRTTVLSGRWRHIWRSTPLVLCEEHLLHGGEELLVAPDPERVAAIDRVLATHPGPLHTVHLSRCFFSMHEHELAQWPQILAGGGVQDLVFVSLPRPVDLLLPAAILRCANLRRLCLGFWTFPDTDNLPDGAGVFPHLQELALLVTVIADRDLDHMLASSPALETLALVQSYRQPKRVSLRGQKLQCMLFWQSIAVELAVVDTPRLERLIMWDMCPYSEIDQSEESFVRVRIAGDVPALKVLGYLDTRIHRLQFGDTIIKADTKASPSSMVPSVKILALKVNLSVFTEVQMLPSFLGCFPNVETLHVESAVADEKSDKHNAEFFEKLSPIECVWSHIMTVFLYKFQGHQSEMAFLKYLSQRANQMQKLTLVLPDKKLDSGSEKEMKGLLSDLVTSLASEACTVLLLRPEVELFWSFHKASDLSIHDPFLLDHGQELFSFIKL